MLQKKKAEAIDSVSCRKLVGEEEEEEKEEEGREEDSPRALQRFSGCWSMKEEEGDEEMRRRGDQTGLMLEVSWRLSD